MEIDNISLKLPRSVIFTLATILIMIRPGKAIGFIVGLFIGIYARDNYLYPYPIRVHDLQSAF